MAPLLQTTVTNCLGSSLLDAQFFFLPSWTLQQTLYIPSPAGSTKLDVWGPRKPQLCYGISPDFSNNIAYIRTNITLDIYGNLFKHSLILSLSDPWTSTIFSSSCPHHILRFRLA